MRLRVCIFTRETALHWAAFYVRAFREVCDTIAIGPACRPEDFADFAGWDYVAPSVVKNDIISDETDAAALLARLPDGWQPDIVITIQSGAPLVNGTAQVGCPTAYLSIDTWHDAREFVVARHYDFVFIAQRALIKYMRMSGCRHVFWLPLACDPAAHYLVPAEETCDLAFVGRYHFFANRQRLARLQLLERHFQVGYYYGLDAKDMARAYGMARLIFNASIAKDVNMRVFEALATGKPLLTNREAEVNGLFDLFEDGKHLIAYADADLVTLVQRCLGDPAWANAIGQAGRREVLEKHTYVHRVNTLLETVAGLVPEFGQRLFPREKGAARITDFVPFGTRRLLDAGLALDASRIALHHRGIGHVAGIAPDETARDRRAKSYDTLTLFDGEPDFTDAAFDAVLWNGPALPGLDWATLFEKSRNWLAEGGTILILLDREAMQTLAAQADFVNLEDWLVNWGYTLLVQRIDLTGDRPYVIVARQWSATVNSVMEMLYREFPANGAAPAFNGEAPDSPDAGHP